MTWRCGHAFSLLELDLQTGSTSGKAPRALADVAADAIRETDVAGWLREDCLGVILPATTAAGAERLGRRMVRLLKTCPEAAKLRFSAREYPAGSPVNGRRATPAKAEAKPGAAPA